MSEIDIVQEITLLLFTLWMVISFFYSVIKRKDITLGNFSVTLFPLAVLYFAIFYVKVELAQGFVWLEVIGLLFVVFGLISARHAFKYIGFTNSDDFWFGRHEKKERYLVTDGPYKYVRHPIAISLMLWIGGMAMVFIHPASATLALIGIVFIIVTSFYEEKFIEGLFPEYSEYKKETNMFVPWFGKKYSK